MPSHPFPDPTWCLRAPGSTSHCSSGIPLWLNERGSAQRNSGFALWLNQRGVRFQLNAAAAFRFGSINGDPRSTPCSSGLPLWFNQRGSDCSSGFPLPAAFRFGSISGITLWLKQRSSARGQSAAACRRLTMAFSFRAVFRCTAAPQLDQAEGRDPKTEFPCRQPPALKEREGRGGRRSEGGIGRPYSPAASPPP